MISVIRRFYRWVDARIGWLFAPIDDTDDARDW